MENKQITSSKSGELENELLDALLFRRNLKNGMIVVKEWLETVKEKYGEMEDYEELVRIMREIVDEKDYSHFAYEDIRFLLRAFPTVPLRIKKNVQFINNGSLYNVHCITLV